MSKVRVYELAKELGLESKQVLEKLEEMGEFARSASSTVATPVARKLRESLNVAAPEPQAPRAGSSSIRTGPRQAVRPRVAPAVEDSGAAAAQALPKTPVAPAESVGGPEGDAAAPKDAPAGGAPAPVPPEVDEPRPTPRPAGPRPANNPFSGSVAARTSRPGNNPFTGNTATRPPGGGTRRTTSYTGLNANAAERTWWAQGERRLRWPW
ncbi:MAG: translation initiation factor IF-2 N-terminal domain-containing protein [Candidatus Nanopelagicales bacterium]|nr:translation initiation factor IF-2 N-terminal domain-containing protein [Candidatus Nanopelagicales bacterium]